MTEEITTLIPEREFGVTCGRDFPDRYSFKRTNPLMKDPLKKNTTGIVATRDSKAPDSRPECYGPATRACRALPFSSGNFGVPIIII